MSELEKNLSHLRGDLDKIHDFLEHLDSHSDVCSELVKASNIRETTELFGHLEQIENRYAGVSGIPGGHHEGAAAEPIGLY